MATKKDTKSQGTKLAEETRSKCNDLSDSQREALLTRALQIIYQGKEPARVSSR
jgi:hypothetical protein